MDTDIGGVGDHVAMIDSHTHYIKEQYCNIKNGLPWALPRSKVKDLVAYVVPRMNVRHTSAINTNVCPKVIFTGGKLDFNK